jgi:hypothetical protein
VTAFDAVVTDFRTSVIDRGTRVITATVRFTNRTDRPLVLGYVAASGISTDDQGNRYVVNGEGGVRGMGEIRSGTFDPKFALRPRESSDARFELVFRQSSATQVLGTVYDLDLTVRQIDPLAGGQFRLGKEHSLHFRGFGSGATTAATGGHEMTAPAAAAAAIGAEVDQCAGRVRCFGAGTFVAEVAHIAGSVEGNRRYHVLRSTIRFRNMSAQPVILAYKAGTSGVTDNLGNRYYWGTSGTYDNSVTGIGKVEGNKADPQFALAPGQTREARFTLYSKDASARQLGTSFTQDLSVVLLEPLPSGQIRVGREFAISFRDLTLGGSAAPRAAGNALAGEAAKQLLEAMRNRGKKP